VLSLALVLLASSEVLPNSSKFGLLSNSTQSLNSLRFFYVQNQSPDDTASSKYASNKSLRLKDPNKALMLAIFPGFFLHGTGHLYAGKPKTALLLFSTQIVGAYLIIGGSFRQSELSEAEDGNGYMIGLIGSFLYFGSWFYDLIGAPLEIKKRNEKLLRSRKIDIDFEINESVYCLKLVKKF
jgi:hypothetical protein